MKHLFVILLSILVFSTASIAIDDETLVLYLPFEEGTGEKTFDQSQTGLEGTLNDGVKWTEEGKVGNALIFENNGYVEIPASDVLNIVSEVTMEAWILPDGVQADSGLCGRRNSSNVGGYCMQWTNGMVETWIHIGGWQGTRDKQTITPEPGEWHYVAAVYDGSSVRQYVDGNLDVEFDLSGEMDSVDQVFRVGQAQTGLESMVGIIDEVAVYNRALSEEEILQDMNQGVKAPISPKGSLAFRWGDIKRSR